jgi:diaminohydroxyphosphoribosylaminopyrimidine deaminase/5-amino-6-(5-phosphoribosylamino)uracil reductase
VIAVGGERADRIGAALDELGGRGITSLLLEGGAGLAGAFLEAGEIDELRLFVAALLLGGGRPLFAGTGAALVADAQRPLASEWERSGDDMLVRARLREW